MQAGGRRHGRWDWALIVVWSALLAGARAGQPPETDPYWQIRDGLELLAGRALVAPDTWSWAPVEGDYVPNSPLWNVILAFSWQAGGFAGFFALTVLSIMGYLLSAAWVSRLVGARLIPTLLAVLCVAVIALPALGPRAALPAQTLMLIAAGLGAVWGRGMGRRAAWVSVLGSGLLGLAVSWIGNWLHLSWGTWALMMIAIWAIVWGLPRVAPLATRLGAIAAGGAGLVGGIVLGPYGFATFAQSSAVAAATRGLITEWSGVLHDELWTRYLIPGLGALALASGAAGWSWRKWGSGNRPGGEGVLILALSVAGIPLALAGLFAIRFVVAAWLLLLPVAAVLVTRGMDRSHARWAARHGDDSRLAEWSTDGYWRVILTLTAVVVAVVAVVVALPLGRPANIDAVRALPEGCRLFSAPNDAASVLLLRPDVAVWIDGRADYWGRARLEDYYAIVNPHSSGPGVPSGTTCVLSSSPQSGLPAWLGTDDVVGQWRLVFDDGRSAVWSRSQR